MQDSMKHCTACHLPETYPGITFDESGVCNFCKNHKDETGTYLGMDALRAKVDEVLSQPEFKDRPYDAAVAFSGGRDSTYLLHFLKNEMKLNVLAVTLSHDFMPDHTRENITGIAKLLGVDIEFIPNEMLNVYGRKCVQAWSRKPNAAMLLTFCTGCRAGLKQLIPNYCREHHIPLLFIGNTRMENMNYRQNLLSVDLRKPSALNKMLGYAGHVLSNPALMVSPKCIGVQGAEFLQGYLDKLHKDDRLVTLAPFRDYFHCPEEKVVQVITDMGWKVGGEFQSTWRSDCYINLLRQYYYDRILGFCDQDVYYAQLIRQGRIGKEEAIRCAAEESAYDPEQIRHILTEYYGLDFDKIEARIAKREGK